MNDKTRMLKGVIEADRLEIGRFPVSPRRPGQSPLPDSLPPNP